MHMKQKGNCNVIDDGLSRERNQRNCRKYIERVKKTVCHIQCHFCFTQLAEATVKNPPRFRGRNIDPLLNKRSSKELAVVFQNHDSLPSDFNLFIFLLCVKYEFLLSTQHPLKLHSITASYSRSGPGSLHEVPVQKFFECDCLSMIFVNMDI